MTSIEELYYAIGELAYAIARVDGKVQKQERDRLHEIVLKGLSNNEHAFDISEIIFRLMEKDKTDSKTSYDWAIKHVKLNSHYLSPKLKQTILDVIEKVAEAYPPITKEEQELIDKAKEEISVLKGDPVFYD